MFGDRSHPTEMYNDAKLFMRYRLHSADIMDLVDLISDNILVAERRGSLTPTLKLSVVLRFFVCGSFQLVFGDLFGITIATVCRTAHRMAAAFTQNLQ